MFLMDDMSFHSTTQNGTSFEIYEFFISRIFRIVFLDCSCPWVTEIMESKTAGKGSY